MATSTFINWHITHHKMADMIYYRNSKIPSNTATSGNQVISTTATTVLKQWATQVQSGFDPSNIGKVSCLNFIVSRKSPNKSAY